MSQSLTLDALAAVLADRAASASGAGRRLLAAVVGAPGSGKSTLAQRLVDAVDAGGRVRAAVLPMDGFHYDDAVLDARGLRARKGAPETFDVGGLRHLLGRLRERREADVAVPVFDRRLEIARAGARIVALDVDVVVVEGNYLLLDAEPWAGLRPLFDASASLDVPEEELRRRLHARWRGLGLSAAEAAAKVDGNDLPNGRLVRERGVDAEFVLRG